MYKIQYELWYNEREIKFQIQLMLLLFWNLLANNCSQNHRNSWLTIGGQLLTG